MKNWYTVTISSFDPHDKDFCWRQTTHVYTTEQDSIGAAFRQIGRPSKNTKVSYRKGA